LLRPISSADEQAWETVTREVLIRAFGSESPNVGAVMDVGRFAFAMGGGEQQWEAQRAEDMETRLKIMSELIEYGNARHSQRGWPGFRLPGVNEARLLPASNSNSRSQNRTPLSAPKPFKPRVPPPGRWNCNCTSGYPLLPNPPSNEAS
jgi:hypothetical protein